MTPEQYDRWKDFAVRAAKTWYATSRRPSVAWVQKAVEGFFEGLDAAEIALMCDWDNSEPYPDRDNGFGRKAYPYCASDELTVFLGSWRQRECAYEFCVVDDDAADERLDRAHEQWDEQWGGPVRCCIRAGLDMACAPSAGVVGFTAGDIRKMYPEGVPEWLFPPDERLMYALSDVENGTFSELPDNAPLLL